MGGGGRKHDWLKHDKLISFNKNVIHENVTKDCLHFLSKKKKNLNTKFYIWYMTSIQSGNKHKDLSIWFV